LAQIRIRTKKQDPHPDPHQREGLIRTASIKIRICSKVMSRIRIRIRIKVLRIHNTGVWSCQKNMMSAVHNIRQKDKRLILILPFELRPVYF
jgi:hypothetical protein